MNGVAFRYALRTSLRSAVIIALVLGAFFWVTLASSAAFLTVEDGQPLPPFLRDPPRVMQAFVGGSAEFTSPVGWVSTGMLHPIVMTLAAMGGLLVVVKTGATELGTGTLDLVLSRPVGRARYLAARAGASLILLTIVEAGAFAGSVVARGTVKGVDRLGVGDLALTFVGHWLLFAVFSMIGLWLFARSSLRSRAMGVTIGVIVGAFFVNFVSLLFDAVSWLGYLTPFHYYSAARVLNDDAYLSGWLVLAAAALVAGAAAFVSFGRRDLTR